MTDGASAQPDDALALVGTVLADRYRVDRFLGAGGMGAVYLAEHVHMHKTVAIKVLHREMTAREEVVQRFEREAVAAGRIDHPNVAAATDFGRLPDGSFYLVLEYVDGRSLRDVLDGGALSPSRALGIAIQVGAALGAAHAAGIVHRDLKPDNVMLVTHPDGREHAKVLDFGIAKVEEPSLPASGGKQLTRIGAVMGTPGYMAPEQALGEAVDARADLYALGVLLHEMLSGHAPFSADDFSQIVAKQLTESPSPLPRGAPPELAALVAELLSPKPAGRPASASDVVRRLTEIRDRESGGGAVAVRTAALEPEPARRGFGWLLLLGGALVGGLVLFGTRRSPTVTETAESASSTPLTAPSAIPPAAMVASAAPSAAAPKNASPQPVNTSHTETSVTETHTKTPDGRTVTTRTTKKSTTTEQRSETHTKKRTGPGGIYIPPPSQWFK